MRANRIVWLVAAALVAVSMPSSADACCGEPVSERLKVGVCVDDGEIEVPCEDGGGEAAVMGGT